MNIIHYIQLQYKIEKAKRDSSHRLIENVHKGSEKAGRKSARYVVEVCEMQEYVT